MIEQKAIIIQKIGIKDHCSTYDPFGLCPVTECFTCGNADYRIIDNNGNIIRDFKFKGLKGEHITVSKYLIEFFDDVDFLNIESYLNNENSDYRMIRTYCTENGEENVLMRPSKEDQRKILEEQKQKNQDYEEMLKMMLGEESYKILCEARENRKSEQKQHLQIQNESKAKQFIRKIINKR